MLTLEQAIERLIASRQFRRAWLAGDRERVCVSEETRAALETIDPQTIADAAILYRRNILERGHRGSGRLLDLYSKTIAGFDPDELIDAFTESCEYEGYRPSNSVAASSLEEAFYRFCCARGVGERVESEREYLAAMMRALAVNETPAFSIPRDFQACRAGWWAISAGGEPHLFAVLANRIVSGPITELVRDLLCSHRSLHQLATQHDVGIATVNEAAAFLDALGLSRACPISMTRAHGSASV